MNPILITKLQTIIELGCFSATQDCVNYPRIIESGKHQLDYRYTVITELINFALKLELSTIKENVLIMVDS